MISTLISLAGAVSLLIWGLYMVKTGILRTFGESLRKWLAKRLTNRFCGFAAGFWLASLLQSSTASALLIASLQNKGLVTTAIALSCVLGADLGSAFVVRVLSLDLSGLIPILIIAGVFLFMRRPETRVGQFGRILLGLAFVMMALGLIVSATGFIKESEALLTAFNSINDKPPLSAGLGIGLAFLCFSSLAVVAISVAVVSAGILTMDAGLWMVLGANLGSALLAMVSTLRSSNTARRAPTGNFIFRTVGFILGVLLLWLSPAAASFFNAPDDLVVFHLICNAVIGALGLLFIHPTACLLDNLLPSSTDTPLTEVRLMMGENLITSSTGLMMAAQEIEKTAHFLSVLWQEIEPLLETNPPAGVVLSLHESGRMIGRRCRSVKRFLCVLLRRNLTGAEAQLWQRLDTANDALHSAGDAMHDIIRSLEKKKIQEALFFSSDGLKELIAEHRAIGAELEEACRLLTQAAFRGKRSAAGKANGRQGAASFEAQTAVAGADVGSAEGSASAGARKTSPATDEAFADLKEELLKQIDRRGQETFNLVEKHVARVAAGRSGAIETSALHVDLLLLFRRLEAAIGIAAKVL